MSALYGRILVVKPVDEPGVPLWLRRRTPDVEALEALPAGERFAGESDARQVFDRLCKDALRLGLGRGFVAGQYRKRFETIPHFPWPVYLPEDVAKKRERLERFAASQGWSSEWVDREMAKGVKHG